MRLILQILIFSLRDKIHIECTITDHLQFDGYRKRVYILYMYIKFVYSNYLFDKESEE